VVEKWFWFCMVIKFLLVTIWTAKSDKKSKDMPCTSVDISKLASKLLI